MMLSKHAAPARKIAAAAKKIASMAQQYLPRVWRFFPGSEALLKQGKESVNAIPVGKRSLRLRLCLFFSAFLVVAWLCAGIFAWLECLESIDEFFDTQQTLFAKRLATMDLSASFVDRLPKTKKMLPKSGSDPGEEDDDALGFAVFTAQGKLVLDDGENGYKFYFDPAVRGFVDTHIAGEKDPWRIFWLDSQDKTHVIAVGQELEYRHDMASDMLFDQITPWLLLLPALLAGLFFLLSRELAPLHSVARQLRTRSPDDTSLLDVGMMPSEVRPMIESLNSLFTRTKAMFMRERAFISDAAHELRTPLAGLRVQAEVALQKEDDPEAREEALSNLLYGIDLSARLVEQLLALSRLEALSAMGTGQGGDPAGLLRAQLDWSAMIREVLEGYRGKADKKCIPLAYEEISGPAAPEGYPTLIALLLRNLLDNAISYTPRGGHVLLRLEERRFVVQNSGPGVPDEYVPKLGERFFRPPGQSEPGSGLGLSIVKKIVEIHGFEMSMQNRKNNDGDPRHGFFVAITFG